MFRAGLGGIRGFLTDFSGAQRSGLTGFLTYSSGAQRSGLTGFLTYSSGAQRSGLIGFLTDFSGAPQKRLLFFVYAGKEEKGAEKGRKRVDRESYTLLDFIALSFPGATYVCKRHLIKHRIRAPRSQLKDLI